jgi:hypothetical protein
MTMNTIDLLTRLVRWWGYIRRPNIDESEGLGFMPDPLAKQWGFTYLNMSFIYTSVKYPYSVQCLEV